MRAFSSSLANFLKVRIEGVCGERGKLNICGLAHYAAYKNFKNWLYAHRVYAYFYFIFMQIIQFPVLELGLAHSIDVSQPFKCDLVHACKLLYTCCK